MIVPELLPGDGAEALDYSRKHQWEGVIAKKRDSTYQPGRRSASWLKDKYWSTQEVVIAGWRAGEGGRTSGIGSLLMGIPAADGGLHFAGRVGTGFTERDLANLKKMLAPLHTDESPFDAPLPTKDAKGVTFVEADAGRGSPVQRMDFRWPAAPAQLARAAARQGTKRGGAGMKWVTLQRQ